ncbi:unnamed protein product [Pleuronectes platessa]|uniref:Uncharacterized protein n=1 Tax=Pleuronectes platessa TaxID=8262 RepID=A0A9N7TSR4_PLEPL|nr:unnamed protein product [Pleuronectes platessa]
MQEVKGQPSRSSTPLLHIQADEASGPSGGILGFLAPPGGSRGVPRPDGKCSPSREFWFYRISQLGMLGKPPVEGVQEEP